MASEKNFENKIKIFLKDHGVWLIKYWAGSQFTKAGIPDILACVNGRFVAIEVKAQNGKPSELQIYNIRKIQEAGGVAVILYPNQFELFKEMISSILRGYDEDAERIASEINRKLVKNET